MSKDPSLMSIVEKKGIAGAPADTEGRAASPRPRKPPQARARPPQAPKQQQLPIEPPAPRKRPWDGLDAPVQVTYVIPERVKQKLIAMKASRQIKGAGEFAAVAIEQAIDKVIEQYDRDMGNGA